jgi:glycosyltransferase involved in cell wall biosynthesis
MACGLPVVATRVGANAELVEEDVTGRTVPAADSEALARAIGGYFAAPGLAREHGQAARRRVERQFNLERMVENYHRVYSDLLASGTRPVETSGGALIRHRGNR